MSAQSKKKIEVRVLPGTPDTTEDTSQQEAFSDRLKREREGSPQDGSNKKAKAEQTEQPAQHQSDPLKDNHSQQLNPAESYSSVFNTSSILGNLPPAPMQSLPGLNNHQPWIGSQPFFPFPLPLFTLPASNPLGNQPFPSIYSLPLLAPPLPNSFYSAAGPQPALINNDLPPHSGPINNHPAIYDPDEITKQVMQILNEVRHSLPQPTPTPPPPDNNTSSSYSASLNQLRSKSRERVSTTTLPDIQSRPDQHGEQERDKSHTRKPNTNIDSTEKREQNEHRATDKHRDDRRERKQSADQQRGDRQDNHNSHSHRSQDRDRGGRERDDRNHYGNRHPYSSGFSSSSSSMPIEQHRGRDNREKHLGNNHHSSHNQNKGSSSSIQESKRRGKDTQNPRPLDVRNLPPEVRERLGKNMDVRDLPLDLRIQIDKNNVDVRDLPGYGIAGHRSSHFHKSSESYDSGQNRDKHHEQGTGRYYDDRRSSSTSSSREERLSQETRSKAPGNR